MHWTKTIIDDVITRGKASTIARCNSRLIWQLCCCCALEVSFPSCNVSGPLLYLLICLLLRPPWSPRGPILLLRLIYCRYSYLRLKLWSNQWKDIRNKVYPSMKTRERIVSSRRQAFLRPGGARTFSSYSTTPVVKRHQRSKYFIHMWNIY
jgi:hypothetical protein